MESASCADASQARKWSRQVRTVATIFSIAWLEVTIVAERLGEVAQAVPAGQFGILKPLLSGLGTVSRLLGL
jgi:hypothetical protein